MTKKTKQFLICIAVPLLVGGLSALITRTGVDTFETINKPSLSPPGWLFPVVWTILFILMGIASYLVLVSEKPQGEINRALTVYGIQLIFNFFWSIFFFNFSLYLFSFIWLVLLWLLIFTAAILFYRISKSAGYLMIPYLMWVAFAGYLNFQIYLLN